MPRKLVLSIILTITLILTGCWDQIEINDRAFISTLGIDKATGAAGGTERYQISYSFPNPSGGYGGGAEVTNVFLSTLASDIYMADRMVATRSSKSIYFGHLRMLLIGEAVARDPLMLRETLDSMERNSMVSRRINIGIASGRAEDVLQLEPLMEGNIGQLLYEIFHKKDRSQRAPLVDLGEVLIDLHENGSTLIPRIVASEKEIKAAGAAVIKDYRLVGWLGEKETAAATMAQGNFQYLIVPIPYNNLNIPVSVTDGSTKYEYVENGNERKILINIEIEGDIEGLYMNPKEDILDQAFIKTLQDQGERLLEESIEGTIEKLQKEFKADVLQLDMYMERNRPKEWKELKEDWDEIYEEIAIEARIDLKIRRVGLTK